MKLILKDKTELNVVAFTSYEKPNEIAEGISYFVEFDYKGVDNLTDFLQYLQDCLNKKGNISKVKFIVDDEGTTFQLKFKEVGFVHFGNFGPNNKFTIRAKLVP